VGRGFESPQLHPYEQAVLPLGGRHELFLTATARQSSATPRRSGLALRHMAAALARADRFADSSRQIVILGLILVGVVLGFAVLGGAS
jgi:hypothetical protein